MPLPLDLLVDRQSSLSSIVGMQGLQAYYDALTASSLTYTAATGATSLMADLSGNSNTNGLVLNGASGNYAQTPDSAAISLTTKMRIILDMAMDSWAPAANAWLAGHGSGNDSSFAFDLVWGTTSVNLRVSSLGTAVSVLDNQKNHNTPFSAFQRGQIAIDFTGNDGSGNRVVSFYKRPDSGSSFTLIGTQTTVGTCSLFDSSKALTFGNNLDASGGLLGKLYRATIYNDVGGAGSIVFDANFEAQARGTTSFTESSSNAATVTVTATGATGARIAGARDLYQGTGANQPIYLPWSGSNYGWLPGVSGNYFSTPDSVAVSITGDIDVRVKVLLPDWTPAGGITFISKGGGAGNRGWYFNLAASGLFTWEWSTDGTTTVSKSSTTGNTITDGTVKWVRIAHDVDNGSGGNDIYFYTSDDGVTWTQLGTTVTTAGTTSHFDSAQLVDVGAYAAGTAGFNLGQYYRAQIYSGIAGVLKADFNPAETTDGSSSWTASTGEVWTVNTSGGKPAMIVGRPGVLFDGSAFDMQTAAFTQNQPTWYVWIGRALRWRSGDTFVDGLTDLSGALVQDISTPQLTAYAGTNIGWTAGLAIGTTGIVTCVFKGATTSLLQINNTVPVTGSSGAGTMGGITLGRRGVSTAQRANILVNAVAIFSSAPTAADIARVVQYFARRWSISV